jgi:hypothetical protein
VNLYGGFHGPAAWNTLLHNWMLTQEFVPDQHDPSIYIKMVKDHNGADAPLTVLFHVDDSLSFHPSEQVLVDFNNELMKAFPGTIKSSVTQFLGMTIRRSEDWSFWISQQPLIEKIYKQCEALAKIPELKARGWYLEPRVAGKDRDSNVPMLQDRLKRTTEPVTAAEQQVLKLFPYAEVLGAIGYVMTCTRPTISFSFKELSRFTSCYRHDHIDALLVLVSYLRRKEREEFLISSRGSNLLRAYTDADWNHDVNHRSTTGWIVLYGDTPISWASRSQKCTSKSTCEAEFVALSSCVAELIHIRRLNDSLDRSNIYNQPSPIHMTGVGVDEAPEIRAVDLFCDSTAAIATASRIRSWLDDKLRHIKTAFFFFRGYVASGQTRLHKVAGTDNPADLLSKGFGKSVTPPGQMDTHRRYKATTQAGEKYFARLARVLMGYGGTSVSEPQVVNTVYI